MYNTPSVGKVLHRLINSPSSKLVADVSETFEGAIRDSCLVFSFLEAFIPDHSDAISPRDSNIFIKNVNERLIAQHNQFSELLINYKLLFISLTSYVWGWSERYS